MPLDPDIAALLQAMKDRGLTHVADENVRRARSRMRALSVEGRDPTAVLAVASIKDTTVAGSVPVRIYRPAARDAVATIVYLHGGGWVLGDLDTHDPGCRQLCNDIPAVVVSVDYRLAPEHRFPAAVEDSYAALAWVAGHIGDYGGDGTRLAVGGDSAGANLAAVCAQLAYADGLPLAAQLLVYPNVDVAGDYPSRSENGQGYFLTTADMDWFVSHYLGMDLSDPAAATLRLDPRLAPLRADSLAGLASAVVATAEYDPLRDEGNRYVAALRAAGCRAEHREFAGLIHGFYGFGAVSPAAAKAVAWLNTALANVLAEPAGGPAAPRSFP